MAEEFDFETGSVFASFIKKTLYNTLDDGTYFTLSPQTLTSLDVVPKLKPDYLPESSSNIGTSRTNATLLAVLDKCRTQSGRRLLTIWLKNPLKSMDKIDTRLDIVQHLVENNELRTICHEDYLKKIPDVLRHAFKISKRKCTLSDLVKIYQSCESTKSLYRSYKQVVAISQKESPEAVKKLFTWIETCCSELDKFTDLIERSIDLDTINEVGEYMIKPSADEEIAKVTLDISDLYKKARSQLSSIAEELELEPDKSIKLETDPEKGFALRVTKQTEQLVRGKSEYEQMATVKKDGYRFTNQALRKLSNKYVNAKQEYNSMAKSIIEDVINDAVEYKIEVVEFSVSITVLDVFVSLAVSAVMNNYVRPLILDPESERICFEKLRHPCLENQPDIENYVPNDILFNKDDKKFFIITGPNMGGKSTFIKSVALAVIMAQCGSMIPADEGRISVIDGVFTRVGAGDRQVEGVSTFMEEMLNMSEILKSATDKSLVIIDELGRGTSTFDGFGLAWSISKHLATKTKCYALFATHFHELTEMEEEVASVGNLHVRAICQAEKLTLLYNISQGPCDESYGINVAQYSKFPNRVIESAKDKLKQFEEVPGFSSKKEVREFVRECTQELMGKALG